VRGARRDVYPSLEKRRRRRMVWGKKGDRRSLRNKQEQRWYGICREGATDDFPSADP
jgi:hypothetical protein